jgi:uncharacterized phage protein (predicted DNA packaging)
MALNDAKAYAKIDINDDDPLIQSLIASATTYINGKTGKTKVKTGIDKSTGLPIYDDISKDELYNLCIKMLVAHWNENRSPQVPGTLTKVEFSVDALISHITLCGDYV